MKKMVFVVFAAMALTFVACGNKTTQTEAVDSTVVDTAVVDTTVVDSLAVDSVVAE